jgi:1-acyl-sn-glycerol-3-phosphate acyltransferase
MAFLRSALFALLFYGLTVIMVIAAFPVLLLGSGPFRRYVRFWTASHGWLARVVLGVRCVVEGPVPAERALIAAKHESAYETFALVALTGDPIIVLKRELAVIPIFGWLTRRYGVMPVDRAASATALRAMLAAADAAQATGRSVLIFPEGTRVAPGAAPKLQAGFAGIYARLALPVVAVATDAGRVWPRGFVKHPGVVRLRFTPPIPADRPRKAIEAEVHAAINALNG